MEREEGGDGEGARGVSKQTLLEWASN